MALKSSDLFIAGDWGTSHLRLFLVDEFGTALDERKGPGAAEVQGAFAVELAALCAAWKSRYGELPTMLCGMVGSNLGWVQTRALSCPIDIGRIVANLSAPAPNVRIVPGLACTNRYGAPDFMRGEETQIFGALKLSAGGAEARRLVCLPGTHTKWAVVEGNVVSEFVSAPTGELYKTLYEHSVLVRERDKTPLDVNAFVRGVQTFNEHPRAQLLHRLFETRARQLDGELDAAQAAGFLSGLLIASDVAGGLDLAAAAGIEAPILIIGAAALTGFYARALEARGRALQELDGSRAAIAGLHAVQRRWSEEKVT
jgi:2-dehydro-3-deoxygalactonokinase